MANQDQLNDALSQGRAIAQSQAIDQRRSIPYRPEYNHITGKVTASIVLQQISFWWHGHGRKPFYKFRAPCKHEKYKDGDSWTEELGMSKAEFDTAIQAIGAKVTQGESKTELLKKHLVIYWTDSNRVTWYQLNEALFYIAIYCAYNAPDVLDEGPISDLPGKLRKSIYLDKSGKSIYPDKSRKSIYIPSKTTTETTTENTTEQQPPASKPKPEPPNPNQNGDFARALRAYQDSFGPLGSSYKYEQFQMLWDEHPVLEVHEYARQEMYEAMMDEKRRVHPNLAYYAQCLATGAARAQGRQQARQEKGKRRDVPKYEVVDLEDPDVQAWLAERRKHGGHS